MNTYSCGDRKTGRRGGGGQNELGRKYVEWIVGCSTSLRQRTERTEAGRGVVDHVDRVRGVRQNHSLDKRVWTADRKQPGGG